MAENSSLPFDRDLIASLVSRPEQHPELRLVKTRRKRGTVRNVYVYQERLVIKEYGAYPWGRWWRKYWQGELTALQRLRGLPVPEGYDYFDVAYRNVRSKVVVRECVDGVPFADLCDPVAPEHLPAIAKLMAQVHLRKVIANDYSLYNIRLASNGEIRFIDFHRARVFDKRNAKYWIHLGKDLACFYRVSCRKRMDLFGPFVAMYLEAMGDLTPAQRRLILGGCRFWCWMRLEPGPPSFDTSAGAPYNQ